MQVEQAEATTQTPMPQIFPPMLFYPITKKAAKISFSRTKQDHKTDQPQNKNTNPLYMNDNNNVWPAPPQE